MLIAATWWLSLALAQDVPVPAPLSARSLDADTPCPDVPDKSIPRLVTTTVGPARHVGDGSYAWICPELWGGALDPALAANPAGGVLAVVADGLVFRSDDGGCSVTGVPLPRGDLEAVDTFYWRDSFWVIAVDEVTTSTEIMQLQDDGLKVLTTLDGIVATDAEPAGVGALWVVGLRPQPVVYRVGFVGGLTGTDAPLTDLPQADRVSALSLAGGDDDEAWVLVERGLEKSLWYGQYLPSTGITLWEETEGSWRTVQGPVLYEGLWLAALGGQLYTAGQITGSFVEVGASAVWTDLQLVGGRLFAGTPTELLAITGFDDDLLPVTAPAFSLSQLARPVAACQVEGCDALLDTIAAEGGLDPDAPAACPDGRTLAELQPESCNCSGSGSGGAGALAIGAVFMARRRRRGRAGSTA